MKSFAILGTLGIVLLAVNPMMAAAKSADAGVPCSSQEDCNKKWQRAEQWVRQNSVWEIRTVSEDLIETRRQSGSGYSNLYYRITKEKQDGQAKIQFSAGCLPSVYCNPNPDKAREAFNQYIQTGQ